MSLRDVQAMFAEALVRSEPLPTSAEWAERGEGAFTGSARLSPIEQLDVYREQFWLRHVHCLEEDFPVVRALLGAEEFEALVVAYVAAHPPTHFQLRHFGDSFATFLAGRDDALLADLARLEWAFVDAFDASDTPPLDPATVAAVSDDAWPGARLDLDPSLQRLRLSFPVHEMRAAWWADKERRPIERVAARPSWVAVYRHERLLYTETLEPLALDLLDRLARGETLGAAGNALGAVEENVGAWFTRWAGLGSIRGVHVERGALTDDDDGGEN